MVGSDILNSTLVSSSVCNVKYSEGDKFFSDSSLLFFSKIYWHWFLDNSIKLSTIGSLLFWFDLGVRYKSIKVNGYIVLFIIFISMKHVFIW